MPVSMIFSEAINRFSRFNRREIISLLVLIATGVIFLVHQAVISPVMDYRKRLSQAIDLRQQQTTALTGLLTEYNRIQTQSDQRKTKITRRAGGFTLFSFLNRLAGQAGIQANIATMKPSRTIIPDQVFQPSVVEIKFQAISMTQLVDWLHRIETSGEMIFIKTASISISDTVDRIDATIQAQTLEP